MTRFLFRFFLVTCCVVFLPSRGLLQTLPDLIPEVSDIQTDFNTFVDAGDVQEGCAAAASGVDLLRFSTLTRNIGAGDLSLGDPQCPDCATNPGAVCGNPLFHCSPADGHDHPHYTNYAHYDLLDANDQVLATSGKFGFCLQDTQCSSGATPHYTCENQGLTAGCSDLYSLFLGCQYIDITTLPNGAYTLRITTDPLNQIAEANEVNNSIRVAVMIDRDREPDEEMLGKSVVLSIKPQLAKTALRLQAKADSTFAPLLSAHAPTLLGAMLTIRDTAAPVESAISIPLAADHWVGLGSPTGVDGFRYKGKTQLGDECNRIELTRTGVTVQCHNLATTPALPVQGQLSVQLRIGSKAKRYCATFGGSSVRNTTTTFTTKNAPKTPCD